MKEYICVFGRMHSELRNMAMDMSTSGYALRIRSSRRTCRHAPTMTQFSHPSKSMDPANAPATITQSRRLRACSANIGICCRSTRQFCRSSRRTSGCEIDMSVNRSTLSDSELYDIADEDDEGVGATPAESIVAVLQVYVTEKRYRPSLRILREHTSISVWFFGSGSCFTGSLCSFPPSERELAPRCGYVC